MPHSEAQASTPLSLGMKLKVLASNHPNNIGQLSQPSCYFWWLTQVIQPEIPIWLTTPQKKQEYSYRLYRGYRHYRYALTTNPTKSSHLHLWLPLKIHWKSQFPRRSVGRIFQGTHWVSQCSRPCTSDLPRPPPMKSKVWSTLTWDFHIPSGYVKIAIENGHRNSGFSHWKWWFSIVMLVYQRVCSWDWVRFCRDSYGFNQQQWGY